MHRQQFDGGDAESPEVRQHGRRGQPGVGAALCLRDAGMAPGGALDVDFVEHRVAPGCGRRCIVAPVEWLVYDAGFDLLFRRDEPVGVETARQITRIGVDKQSLRIEPVAVGVRPVGAEGIAQAGFGARKVAMPDLVGAARQGQGGGVSFFEDAQLDAFRMRGKDGEVDAFAIPVRPERPGPAFLQTGVRDQASHSRKTVASGGRVSAIDHSRPCAGVGSASTRPNGLPTLLPP